MGMMSKGGDEQGDEKGDEELGDVDEKKEDLGEKGDVDEDP